MNSFEKDKFFKNMLKILKKEVNKMHTIKCNYKECFYWQDYECCKRQIIIENGKCTLYKEPKPKQKKTK